MCIVLDVDTTGEDVVVNAWCVVGAVYLVGVTCVVVVFFLLLMLVVVVLLVVLQLM